MKSLLVLLAAAASLSLLALGQAGTGSASPSPAAASPAPAAAPSLTGSAAASGVPLPGQPGGPVLDKPMPLMPEPIPSGDEAAGAGQPGRGGRTRKSGPAASPGGSPTNTFDVEQDIRIHIRIRKAETIASSDPQIEADWLAAHATRTDPDRRAAFTKYYNDLFARVARIDPTIAQRADLRRQDAIDRLHYTHLGDEPPELDPFATPPPAAEGPNPPTTDLPPSF